MMRPVPFCLALAVLTAPAGLAAQQPDARATVAVGTASARRGQVAYGAIRVPAGVDSATDLPIAVVNGTRPGPVVALVAGSHGTEYTSIVALTRIIGQLDPRTISGTVIVAPLLNVASFTQMTVHLNPVDGKGMNGQYPGDPAGTQTQRALAAVADQVVKPADVMKTCVPTVTGSAAVSPRRIRHRGRWRSRSASTTSSCATSISATRRAAATSAATPCRWERRSSSPRRGGAGRWSRRTCGC